MHIVGDTRGEQAQPLILFFNAKPESVELASGRGLSQLLETSVHPSLNWLHTYTRESLLGITHLSLNLTRGPGVQGLRFPLPFDLAQCPVPGAAVPTA